MFYICRLNDPAVRDEQQYSFKFLELLNSRPSWLVRSGLAFFLIVIVVILIFTSYISFPEKVTAAVKLASANHRKNVIANGNGRLEVKKTNSSNIQFGEVIGVVHSSDESEIFQLYQFLHRADLQVLLLSDTLKTFQKLGSLTLEFSALNYSINQYNTLLGSSRNAIQIKDLEDQIYHNTNLLASKQEQLKIANRLLELNKNNFNRDKLLFEKEAIEKVDLDHAETIYLNSLRDSQNNKHDIVNLESMLAQLKHSKKDLAERNREDSVKLANEVFLRYTNLLGMVDLWAEKNVIKAPCDGLLVLNEGWNVGKVVTIGEEVASVIPKDEHIFAVLGMSSERLGRVKPGQRVIIKLATYPYEEFGFIEGHVKEIYPIPKDDIYTVIVDIGSELVTNLKITIPYQPEIPGTAEVITADKSILRRIIEKIVRDDPA